MATYEDISSDEDASQLFITQSSFREVETQEAEEAVDFFEGLGDVSVSDSSILTARDLAKLHSYNVDQNEMCSKIFDFSEGPLNNGWTVQSQDNADDPFIVTRNNDGKQFVVGEGFCEPIDEFPKSKVTTDDKRFESVVTDADVDRSKNKR